MPKEIYLKTDYGTDKIRLIIQDPPAPSEPPSPSGPRPADALRAEIRAILSHELSEQLQCRKRECP